MIDPTFIAHWTARLQEIPEAAAILLKGSYARGEPGPFSDVDFDVLVDPGPGSDYVMYLVEHDSGQLIHVSVATHSVATWLDEAHEPEPWTFGLPAFETTRLLWARNEVWRSRLDRPAREHPPGVPELEDFVEAFGKVKNASIRRDELALRLAAQTLAGLCPSLLRAMNPDVSPTHHDYALQAVLTFPVAPEGYRNDLLHCLGLSGQASTSQEIYAAAQRVTEGTISLLREHAHLVLAELPPELYGYLCDGTLERYIRQDAREGNDD